MSTDRAASIDRAARVLRRIRKIPHEEYVIHGSLERSTILSPRRPPQNARNPKLRQKAVYATSVVAIAVFYATICDEIPLWRYRRGGKMILFAPRGEISFVDGYIHVCRRISFKGNALISSSRQAVRPVETIRVPAETVQILEEWGEVTIENV